MENRLNTIKDFMEIKRDFVNGKNIHDTINSILTRLIYIEERLEKLEAQNGRN